MSRKTTISLAKDLALRIHNWDPRFSYERNLKEILDLLTKEEKMIEA
jgi:hypothetical protein